MPDGLQPPSSSSSSSGIRRGPPPLPRAAVDSQPSIVSPSADSPVDELLALVAAEAEWQADGGQAKRGQPVGEGELKARRRAADLRIRAAMLAWDARADVKKALALVNDVDHPLAPALKLAAAIELRDEALLSQCIAETRKRGDKADLTELGSLLVWRARDAMQAVDVLGQATDDARLPR